MRRPIRYRLLFGLLLLGMVGSALLATSLVLAQSTPTPEPPTATAEPPTVTQSATVTPLEPSASPEPPTLAPSEVPSATMTPPNTPSPAATELPRLFDVLVQIGDPHPQSARYNRAFDQYAMINVVDQLVLVDAQTYQEQHILYQGDANINAFRFSNDGRWLAIAIDIRVEVWDTQTGLKVVEITPDGALSTQRPLYWSDDDTLLSFETVIRAPQAIRRSENDTSILPWLWDVAAARRERGSRLPDRASAQPFFD
ncbi:MAG: hypothetical protein H7Y11_04765, partial [Armatimonadetes bacterium]|nr:hypothetical protein [Anaerolineae bacterium]